VTKPTEPQDSNPPSRSSRPNGDGGAADVPHVNGATRPESAVSPPELSPSESERDKPSLADAATVRAAVPPTEPKINGNGRAMRLPPPWQRVPAGGPGEGSTGGDLSSARTVSMSSDPSSDPLSDPPTTRMRVSAPAAAEPDEGMTTPGGFPMSWPRNRRPRQAALQLKRLDPWSVLKVALVLAVVLYLVWLVAVGMLYGVLDGIGVWDRLNGQYADLVSEQGGGQLISAGRVFGAAAVLGAVNSLLFAVALSVGAFIYNVSADLVGGIEVTLSERD
jgi:hypothetical protein